MTGRRTRYFSSTGFRDQSQEEADDSGCRRSPGIVPPLALPVLNDVLSGVDQLTVCFFLFFFSSSFQRVVTRFRARGGLERGGGGRG